ncbi:MAG: hypothetical protein HDS39_06075 [Bacteroides sp.]|nr:hypothetical protein [Bacteroides sp.]
MEKQCKWHFADRSATDQYSGPNNPTIENFNGNGGHIKSLIREVIQNSLDARKSFDSPVIVKFGFCNIQTKDFPELLNLKDTLQACKDFYPTNYQAKEVYNAMLRKLDQFRDQNTFECLRIQDFGTKGMDYVPVRIDTEHNNKFLAFMRSLGVHSQQEHGTGGSFGFGKAAYFGLSPFSTVLASTCSQDIDGEYNYYFEGTTWLSTHYYEKNGERNFKSHVGYYDNNDGEPISNYDDIPEIFRRNKEETGTTFYLLGIESGDTASRNEIYEKMFVQVLENFWLAIYYGELIVEIGRDNNLTLNKDNLKDRIDYAISNNMSFSRDYNPKPFFDAITNDKSLHKIYDLGMDSYGNSYGKLQIFLTKDKEGINKFQRSRRLLMTVENKKGTTTEGYNGITLLSDGYGDKLMQKSEPPAHNKWDYTRLPARSSVRKEARYLLDKISELEQACVAELFDHASRNRDHVKDIHQYCAIVDEKSKREDDDGLLESNNITTEKENEHLEQKKQKIEGIVLSTITSTTEPEKGGPLRGGTTNTTSDKTRKPGRKRPGDTKQKYAKSSDGKERRLYDPTRVKVHCVALKNNNNEYEHELLVTSMQEEIKDASIIVKVEGAAGSQNVKINHTNTGKVCSTHPYVIEGINLTMGLNRIKIKFEDSSRKYAISLSIKY